MAKTILVIEDDPEIIRLLEARLVESGFNVLKAMNGVDALTIFNENKPDLAIIDLILPNKSGFEVIEEIRIKIKSEMPIIVLSNLDQPQDRETAARLGVNEYIVKSNISLRDLVISINNLLK